MLLIMEGLFLDLDKWEMEMFSFANWPIQLRLRVNYSSWSSRDSISVVLHIFLICTHY